MRCLFAQNVVLDSSFNRKGFIIANPDKNHNVYFFGLGNLVDDKIIIAGSTVISMQYITLMRFRNNGQADLDYSNGGVSIDKTDQTNNVLYGMLLLRDGKILIHGGTQNRSDGSFDVKLLKYNFNGTYDDGFAVHGKKVIDFGSAGDYAVSAMELPAGQILLGASELGNPMKIVLFQLNGKGDYITNFGNNGVVKLQFPWKRVDLISLHNQKNGNILVQYTYMDTANGKTLCVMRLRPNGLIDSTFGLNGNINVETAQNYSYGSEIPIEMQTDDKFVHCATYLKGIRVFRFNSNGMLDSTFATQGKLTFAVKSRQLKPFGLQITNPKGFMLAATSADSLGTYYLHFTKLDSAGNLDNDFGILGNEEIVQPFPNQFSARKLMLLAGEKMMVAGNLNGPNKTVQNIGAARYFYKGAPKNQSLNWGEFKIFPNPARQDISIQFGLSNTQVVNAGLYDLTGKEICNFMLNFKLGQGNYLYNFKLPEHAAQGMYIVRFSVDENVTFTKIMFL